MTKKFQDNVLKAISFVPGLVGLSKLNSDSNKPLSDKDLLKGVAFEETKQGFYIRVGAIIDADVKAKIVAKELTSSIRQVAKATEFKIKKVIVYIKGVK